MIVRSFLPSFCGTRMRKLTYRLLELVTIKKTHYVSSASLILPPLVCSLQRDLIGFPKNLHWFPHGKKFQEQIPHPAIPDTAEFDFVSMSQSQNVSLLLKMIFPRGGED